MELKGSEEVEMALGRESDSSPRDCVESAEFVSTLFPFMLRLPTDEPNTTLPPSSLSSPPEPAPAPAPALPPAPEGNDRPIDDCRGDDDGDETSDCVAEVPIYDRDAGVVVDAFTRSDDVRELDSDGCCST